MNFGKRHHLLMWLVLLGAGLLYGQTTELAQRSETMVPRAQPLDNPEPVRINETPNGPPEVAPITPPDSLEEPPPESRSLLRIGFLYPDSFGLDLDWYRRLKQFILDDAGMQAQMQEDGVETLALRPCDHAEDMVQRLIQEEFDVVFCPAMAYVQQRLALERQGRPNPYQVIFQTRRRGSDQPDSRGSGQVRQVGVLFARHNSALAKLGENPEPRALKNRLAQSLLAVPGSSDVAGFFYIRKMLWEQYNQAEPGEFLFCGSGREVVKAVISGLLDVGACEENTLREVLAAIPAPPGEKDHLITILGKTGPVPTDPVLIHQRLAPTSGELGARLISLIRDFYNLHNQKEMEAPLLEPGEDRIYAPLEEDLKLTREYQW